MIEFNEKTVRLYEDSISKETHSTKLNVICSCKQKCSYKSKTILNETKFDSMFTSLISKFLGYRLVNNPDFTYLFRYNDTIKRNVTNHLKIMSLIDNNDNQPETQDEICNDLSSYNYLIEYLNGCNTDQIKDILNKKLIDNFEQLLQAPSKILNLLNEILFNGTISDLWLRLGSCKNNRITEFTLEKSCSGKLHLILKLNRLQASDAKKAIRGLLIEMAIYYLNCSFKGQFYERNTTEIFDKLEEYLNIILFKLSSLTQIELNIPYETRQLIVYNFDLKKKQSVNKRAITNQLELYYFLPYLSSNTLIKNHYFDLWTCN